MWGGLAFVFGVWFVPLILWLILDSPFKKQTNCNVSEKENKLSKRIFTVATIIGIIVMILVAILGK